MATRPPTVRVKVYKEVIAALEGGIAEGVLDTAQAGKERALEYARSKFRTTRHFQRNAFATMFDDTQRKGDTNGPTVSDFRGKGPVAYFGYDWFVARFYETGTVHNRPRPSIAPAANELDEIMPGKLAAAAKQRGF